MFRIQRKRTKAESCLCPANAWICNRPSTPPDQGSRASLIPSPPRPVLPRVNSSYTLSPLPHSPPCHSVVIEEYTSLGRREDTPERLKLLLNDDPPGSPHAARGPPRRSRGKPAPLTPRIVSDRAAVFLQCGLALLSLGQLPVASSMLLVVVCLVGLLLQDERRNMTAIIDHTTRTQCVVMTTSRTTTMALGKPDTTQTDPPTRSYPLGGPCLTNARRRFRRVSPGIPSLPPTPTPSPSPSPFPFASPPQKRNDARAGKCSVKRKMDAVRDAPMSPAALSAV